MKDVGIQMCTDCKKKPVHIIKWGLCQTCYHRGIREKTIDVDGRSQAPQMEHRREMEFIRDFFTHREWMYEPMTFDLGTCSYTPDFLDVRRNILIEVVGTRQAFSRNKEKYKLFAERFPMFPLEFRSPGGVLLDPDKPLPSNELNK